MKVWDLDRQLQAQRETNHGLKVRNATLEAEVRDLKQGLHAVEERARSELGLTRHDEIFVQILD
jgi:cell division protein FtsB